MCILELSIAICNVMTVQVDESVGFLNRPMHFIVCIDTSLDMNKVHSRTNYYVSAECSIIVVR